MLKVLRVHLASDVPIVGCELFPYVPLERPDFSISTDDVPESSPLNGQYLRCRWHRGPAGKIVCCVHPTETATIQCIECMKYNHLVSRSYHCSAECFVDFWKLHCANHAEAASTAKKMDVENAERTECFNSTGASSGRNSMLSGFPGTFMENSNGIGSMKQVVPELWTEVGRCKTYTPTVDDVGHILRVECVVADAITKNPLSDVKAKITQIVIPAPLPTPRCMIPLYVQNGSASEIDSSVSAFNVLSYNVLADLYAINEVYSYCPPWALTWSYRRQNLLREILGYRADIICLQEVQSDHFNDFFAPELEKHGYVSVYKRKTTEVYTGTNFATDGCATFFKREHFSLVKKYEVEFNKAAQSMMVPLMQNNANLARLMKDNVALIVVLEAREAAGFSLPGKRQLLCVANTHLNANRDLKDVKLWQVHTLTKGLEKIAASADIPMIVCGDFNSVPGSAPHLLLATGRVDPSHPDLEADPLGILRPASKLFHQLPLVSAYSMLAKMGTVRPGYGQQNRIDMETNEPLFTNFSRDFLGTLDYIFYTADSLSVEALLELVDEESLRKDTALPSPEWSSDHIALLVRFQIKYRQQ